MTLRSLRETTSLAGNAFFASIMFYLLLSLFTFFPPQTSPTVEWLSPTTHDFGDIRQGKPVSVEFKFKNTGEAPMTIDNVRTTCGCTSPDWDQEVIPPGGDGLIKIEFSAKKPGYFYKKITVFFSTQRKGEKLYIEGYVE
ncbi:MAG TPA: DUF1573 domain-containing protein [Bacteroidetes bacterium]|nr:DUF1573 domain-containing protein [Bacteroidota bacterium]